jgi:methylenetetrahydrofolate reductase (NADPH)
MAPTSSFKTLLEQASRPTLSFEFFPPKDEPSRVALDETVEQLAKISPDFVSVTYGAMGSNQESSVSVVEKLATQFQTIAHLTCVGSTRNNIEQLLNRYSRAGVAGILALRGDKPANFDLLPNSDYRVALDLVNQVVRENALPVGVAAFPEKHPESPSLEHDIMVLKLKQDAGAEFAMTQLFFSLDSYVGFVSNARAAGVTIPIIPGVMPINNVKKVMRMAEMSGAAVPKALALELSGAASDAEAQKIGMDFTVGLALQLLEVGAPGLHIFTLNQHRAAIEVARSVGLC